MFISSATKRISLVAIALGLGGLLGGCASSTEDGATTPEPVAAEVSSALEVADQPLTERPAATDEAVRADLARTDDVSFAVIATQDPDHLAAIVDESDPMAGVFGGLGWGGLGWGGLGWGRLGWGGLGWGGLGLGGMAITNVGWGGLGWGGLGWGGLGWGGLGWGGLGLGRGCFGFCGIW
jgi:hypothetical protein